MPPVITAECTKLSDVRCSTLDSDEEVCGYGIQLSHCRKFQSHSSASQTLDPIRFIFPYHIPIPDYLTLTTMWNNINGNSYSTSLISHSIVLATQIHDSIFNTIHHCVTEDRHESHYRYEDRHKSHYRCGPLCESRKEHKV